MKKGLLALLCVFGLVTQAYTPRLSYEEVSAKIAGLPDLPDPNGKGEDIYLDGQYVFLKLNGGKQILVYEAPLGSDLSTYQNAYELTRKVDDTGLHPLDAWTLLHAPDGDVAFAFSTGTISLELKNKIRVALRDGTDVLSNRFLSTLRFDEVPLRFEFVVPEDNVLHGVVFDGTFSDVPLIAPKGDKINFGVNLEGADTEKITITYDPKLLKFEVGVK